MHCWLYPPHLLIKRHATKDLNHAFAKQHTLQERKTRHAQVKTWVMAKGTK